MEKETMMSDKDLSWFLGVEDETENESTSQEATAVPEEKDQQTRYREYHALRACTEHREHARLESRQCQDEKENIRRLQASLSCAN